MCVCISYRYFRYINIFISIYDIPYTPTFRIIPDFYTCIQAYIYICVCVCVCHCVSLCLSVCVFFNL